MLSKIAQVYSSSKFHLTHSVYHRSSTSIITLIFTIYFGIIKLVSARYVSKHIDNALRRNGGLATRDYTVYRVI